MKNKRSDKVNKKNKKGGFVVTAELIFVSTVMVVGLLTGYVALRDAMVGELNDVGQAIGKLNQSYTFTGTANGLGQPTVYTKGSLLADDVDTGDEDLYGAGRYDVQVAPEAE